MKRCIHSSLLPTYISIVQYDTDGSGMIEFPEFCNMMSDKMNTVNDADMIRMAFRVLDKYGTGTISSKNFKHLMTHIGNYIYFVSDVCMTDRGVCR